MSKIPSESSRSPSAAHSKPSIPSGTNNNSNNNNNNSSSSSSSSSNNNNDNSTGHKDARPSNEGIRLPPISFISGLQPPQAPLSINPLSMPKLSSSSASNSPITSEPPINNSYNNNKNIDDSRAHPPSGSNSPRRYELPKLASPAVSHQPLPPFDGHHPHHPQHHQHHQHQLQHQHQHHHHHHHHNSTSGGSTPAIDQRSPRRLSGLSDNSTVKPGPGSGYQLPSISSFQTELPSNRGTINSILNGDSRQPHQPPSQSQSQHPYSLSSSSSSVPAGATTAATSAAAAVAAPGSLNDQDNRPAAHHLSNSFSHSGPVSRPSQIPKHRTYSSSSNINSLLNNDAPAPAFATATAPTSTSATNGNNSIHNYHRNSASSDPQTLQTRIIIHQHHPNRLNLNNNAIANGNNVNDEQTSTSATNTTATNTSYNLPNTQTYPNNNNGAIKQQQHQQHSPEESNPPHLVPQYGTDPDNSHKYAPEYLASSTVGDSSAGGGGGASVAASSVKPKLHSEPSVTTITPSEVTASLPAQVPSSNGPSIATNINANATPINSIHVAKPKPFRKPKLKVSNSDARKFAAQFPRKNLGTILYTLSPTQSLKELFNIDQEQKSGSDINKNNEVVPLRYEENQDSADKDLQALYKREIRKNDVFLLPELRNHINSILTVRVPRYYLNYKNNPNLSIKKRSLWGTDIYTDDSDVVAILKHCGFLDNDDETFSGNGENKEDLDKDEEDDRIKEEKKILRDLHELIGEQERVIVTPGYESNGDSEGDKQKPNVLFNEADEANEVATKVEDAKTANDESSPSSNKEQNNEKESSDADNKKESSSSSIPLPERKVLDHIEPTDILGFQNSNNQSDITVELLILPTLKEYRGSFRNNLNSRSWTTSHDGVSIALYSVRYDNLQHKGRTKDGEQVFKYVKYTHKEKYANYELFQRLKDDANDNSEDDKTGVGRCDANKADGNQENGNDGGENSVAKVNGKHEKPHDEDRERSAKRAKV